MDHVETANYWNLFCKDKKKNYKAKKIELDKTYIKGMKSPLGLFPLSQIKSPNFLFRNIPN